MEPRWIKMNNPSTPPPRSTGSNPQRRTRQPWPADKPFRILSIDGGGIRGIFPASILAGLEDRFLRQGSITDYFDLVAGTSTGGILALGLGASLKAQDLRDLYVDRGNEIFPPGGPGWIGQVVRAIKASKRVVRHTCDEVALEQMLGEILGDRAFGSSRVRLCVPSFDGVHGEVYIFKTPHHPDFKLDWKEPMTKVALATSAAPTFFRPLRHRGYTLVDGGVWANNPIMIAVTEALTSFDVTREQVKVLSLGCGDEPYEVAGSKLAFGGLIAWRDIIFGAMRLQSQNALGQARLLLGPENVTRIDAPAREPKIQLDDWRRARDILPPAAEAALEVFGTRITTAFLNVPAAPYLPLQNLL